MTQDLIALGNLPEFSVSEISQAVRQTLETRFDRICVRGEISSWNLHGSGHLYLTLKDQDAALEAVCWKALASKLRFKGEIGLEVRAIGRISSFAGSGRSKYQLIIESLEPAGLGALLAQLEERKKRLAAEGLFDDARKKPIPVLPSVIGVVTSPTGAVIRDILHRLRDRFPRPVLVWPVRVQGDGAAEEIAAAIQGFNNLPLDGPVPRPDLLIVARGGGSVEDLWAFNEEIVVRAVAASHIPIIAGVGHETDTTLIDFVADRRAPTPTAAAEFAVPVRTELLREVMGCSTRLTDAALRYLREQTERLTGLNRGLSHPRQIIDHAVQRLDDLGIRLGQAQAGIFNHLRQTVARLAAQLPTPRHLLTLKASELTACATALARAMGAFFTVKQRENSFVTNRLHPDLLHDHVQRADDKLHHLARLLDNLSYEAILKRGFVLVRDAASTLPVVHQADLHAGQLLQLQFHDGIAEAQIPGKPAKPAKSTPPTTKQERLL